jgi:hypothetical protein
MLRDTRVRTAQPSRGPGKGSPRTVAPALSRAGATPITTASRVSTMTTRRPDLYAMLGARPSATRAEIGNAYRALFRRHHPDTGDRSTPLRSSRPGRPQPGRWQPLNPPGTSAARHAPGPRRGLRGSLRPRQTHRRPTRQSAVTPSDPRPPPRTGPPAHAPRPDRQDRHPPGDRDGQIQHDRARIVPRASRPPRPQPL